MRHCSVCHLRHGEGAPGFIPPLRGVLGDYLRVDGARRFFIVLLTDGMYGRIIVKGKRYDSDMPAFKGVLSDGAVARVLNYVFETLNRGSLPTGFRRFSEREVGRSRNTSKTPLEVHALRARIVSEMARKGLQP